MIVPKLQCHEWIEGYRGRLARINQIESRTLVEDDLGAHINYAGTSSTPGMATLVAAAMARPLLDVIMANTLWPALVSVDRPDEHEIVRLARSGASRQVFARTLRLMTWFCPRCAADEYARWRFSVWHRAHQMPGEAECQTHGVSLHAGERTNLLRVMPHECSSKGASASHPLAEHVRTDAVRRALEVMRLAASGKFNLSFEKCEISLKRKAGTLGSGDGASDAIAAVKLKVRDLFSAEWLSDAMPGARAGLESLAFVDSILGTRTPAWSAAAIAITAATLYEDPASALNECQC